jgi:Kef-type K+ transport system membrane component KefB
MILQISLLVIFCGLMQAARSFSPMPGLGAAAGGAILATGFLLLAANLSGSIFKGLGLPRLTGYLMLGIVAGPKVLDLVSDDMVVSLRIFNGVAISLIALTAGSELEFRKLRPLLKTIAWISGVAIIGTMILLTGAVFAAQPYLPFLRDLDTIQAAALALVLGVTMTAQSPAVVVALRKETNADGPLARTVLGVVVLADLMVILCFAIASSIATALLGGQAKPLETFGLLTWEILGSLVTGVLIGVVMVAFMRRARTGGGIFIILVGFVIAEVGQRIHFDPLLVALAAGIFVRNLTHFGDRLHDDIEASSLPVYVAFFAVAGATIHVDELLVVGVPALVFVLIRAGGFMAGNRLACHIAGAPEVVKRFAGFGLLPQAGLALALALLFTRTFPDFGDEAAALIFSVVAINELVAPIGYRWALIRSGEAGQEKHSPEAEAWRVEEPVAVEESPAPG